MRSKTMIIYNVSVSVVELVAADSEESAILALRKRLVEAGFTPIGADAFISEEQAVEG
jgi:hypothetical protein